MHWYLFPFSFLYFCIVEARNKFFDWGWLKSKSFDFPIISVGNISVGGTGKTPHIEYLIGVLKAKYSIGIISRGYKRKTQGFVEVTVQSKARDVGDEPLQIKQKFQNMLVVVDEKRVHAVEKLRTEKKVPDVILLDDAFQHRHITPGLNILLIDYSRPTTKDFMLPVGRLREPSNNMQRAHIVILTKCPGDLNPIDFRIMKKELNLFPYQNCFFTTFKYKNLKPVFGTKGEYKILADLNGIETLVVTGIANPIPIYKKLEEVGAKITKLSFPDHHEFTSADINKIVNAFLAIKEGTKVLVCTEKDAVRFKTGNHTSELTRIPIYSIPIEVEFLNNEELKFISILEKFVDRKPFKNA